MYDNWQKDSIGDLLAKHSALLIEPIGSGKTYIMAGLIKCLWMANVDTRIIVAVGTGHKQHWVQVIKEIAGVEPIIYEKGPLKSLKGQFDKIPCLICTHYTVRGKAETLAKLKPDTLIIDEPSIFKSHESVMNERFRDFTVPLKRVYGCMWPPFEKNLLELGAVMNVIAPGAIGGSYSQFLKDHVVFSLKSIQTRAGWIEKLVPSYHHVEELFEKVSPYFVSNSDDTLKDLIPDLEVHTVKLVPSEEQLKAINEIHDWAANSTEWTPEIRGNTAYQREIMICSHGPDSAKMRWLREHLKCLSLEKAIVYSSYHETHNQVLAICHALDIPYVEITGRIPPTAREALIKEFWDMKVGGVCAVSSVGEKGLNLQCARSLVLVDHIVNLVRLRQIIGRIYRRGQLHEKLDVYNLLLKGTKDEYGMRKLKQESAMVEQFLGQKLGTLGVG